MPNTVNYVDIDPSPEAHMIADAPENYNQQYDMEQYEYEQAVQDHNRL